MRSRSLFGLVLLLVAGCQAPERPTPQIQLRETAPLAGTPTTAPGWPAADWWQRFADPQLNQLMKQALAGSPTLDVARTRFQRASAQARRQKADLSPEVIGLLNGSYSVSHSHIDTGEAGTGNPQIPNKVTSNGHGFSGAAGARLTWDLDIWGRKQAALQQALDQSHAARASQSAALIALQHNLAALYFQWQALAARHQVLNTSLATAHDLLRIAQVRINAGVEDPDAADQARARIAQVKQQIAMLTGQQQIIHAQIAALLGQSDNELAALKARPLPKVAGALPADARVGLMARRPDIVAARWQVEAAVQGIEQARAAYYPDISLNGLGGYLKLYPNMIDGSEANVLTGMIGPAVSLPIFEGDRLDAAFAASTAQREAAIAHYNQTVVEAAQQVAEAVLRLHQLSQAALHVTEQYQASDAQYQRALHREQQGVDDPRQVLAARLQRAQQRDQQLQLHAQRLQAQLDLIYQLGGGFNTTSHDASTPHPQRAKDHS